MNPEGRPLNGQWQKVTLGELMARGRESLNPADFSDEVFELYSIPAFDRREPEIVRGSQIGSTKQLVQSGDVMISKIVPHIRRAWVVGVSRGNRTIASSEWIVFRDQRFEPRFMRHQLVEDRFYTRFMRTVSGVGGSLLRARPAHVAQIQITLPPLAEQQRIADVLDGAEALRTKRRAALAELDSLTQSIFLDLFGDPATNPKKWLTVSLQECTELIQIGPFGSLLHQEDYVTDGVPLVNPKHIQNGAIVIGRAESVTQRKYRELDAYHLKPGDVVMGRRGEMGRCAIVQSGNAALICGTGSLFVRPNHTQTTTIFLYALLSSKAVKLKLQRLALGQTLPNLNSRIVENLRIPLAPLALQHEFAHRVALVEKLKAAQRASLAEMNALFASLQHRAFNGQL